MDNFLKTSNVILWPSSSDNNHFVLKINWVEQNTSKHEEVKIDWRGDKPETYSEIDQTLFEIWQWIATRILNAQWMELANPAQDVMWEFNVNIDASALLQMLIISEYVESLLEKNKRLESENTRLTDELLEEKMLNPEYIPQEDYVFERDGIWWTMTYGELWKKLSTDNGLEEFIGNFYSRPLSDIVDTLKHLHRFYCPSNYQDTDWDMSFLFPEKTRSWKATKKLRNMLATQDPKTLDIDTIAQEVQGKTNTKYFIQYCLWCYKKWIRLSASQQEKTQD